MTRPGRGGRSADTASRHRLWDSFPWSDGHHCTYAMGHATSGLSVRALVAYASRHGSTEEIAAVVAGVLRRHRLVVDVRSVDTVTGLGAYRAVVLGSALYAGHWLDSAVSFVQRHAAALASLPVWVFSSGPLGGLTPDVLAQPDDADELLGAFLPEEHVVFPGRLDFEQLDLHERLLMRAVGATAGDHRDWPLVERWAGEVAEAILAVP